MTLIIVQCVFWGLLSGQFHNTLLLSTGAASILFTAWLGQRMRIVDHDTMPHASWIRLLLYIPYLLWEIILANWDVMKRVFAPHAIDPRMIMITYGTKTAFGTTTYANSITLTPGTVTVEISKDNMTIHALTQEAEDGLREGTMEAKCKQLEGTN
ncbi:MAG: Na+/H+ antiporter subunit E [Nannocystaceae bacterium]